MAHARRSGPHRWSGPPRQRRPEPRDGRGRPGRTHRGRGSRRRHRAGGAQDGGRRPRRPPARAGVPGLPRAPGGRRRGARRLRPHRGADPRGVPGAHPGVRREPPGGALDHRGRLVDGELPRRDARPLAPRRAGAGPTGVPAQPGPPRRMGELQGARDRRPGRAHTGPRRRPDRAGRGRCPHRHAPGRRDGARGGARACDHGGRAPRRTAAGPDAAALAGHHRLAGRGGECVRSARRRGRGLPCRPGRGRAHRTRGRGAVVGTRPGPGAGRPAQSHAGGADRRSPSRDQRQDHAGRGRGEPHRGDAEPLPPEGLRLRFRRHARRSVVRRSGGAARLRHGSGPGRLPGALPRARRSGGPGGARRRRGGPHDERLQRPPSPPGSPSGGPPRRHSSFPGARGHRQHAAAVGRARAPDGRPDHPVPRPGAVVVAVPVRRPAPCRRHPRGGQRLAGEQRRPDPGHARRGEPRRPRRRGRGVLPRAADRPGERARGVHLGHGVREPPRRHRDHHGRELRRPRRRWVWSASPAPASR